MEAGDEIPADVIPPPLPPEAAFAYQAFNEIASDRQIGMMLGPIPFTAIEAYARRYRLRDLDEFDRFRGLIRTIEREQNRAIKGDV